MREPVVVIANIIYSSFLTGGSFGNDAVVSRPSLTHKVRPADDPSPQIGAVSLQQEKMDLIREDDMWCSAINPSESAGAHRFLPSFSKTT